MTCTTENTSRVLRIGIVAGEASGDILGAGLIQALKKKYPDAIFEGVAGPLMLAEGCHSFFPQDRLAVMGFVEPLKRLPELLRIRKFLREHFLANPPDAFIGIDSPDFNLGLELALKNSGIKTVHYVSPSVWAWRRGRVKKIAKAVDTVLTLFPFEKKFYDQCNIPAIFVGHTLADDIAMSPDVAAAKTQLGVAGHRHKIIALLPGSRGGEVERMLPVFLDAANICIQQDQHILFLIPAANEKRQQQIDALVVDYPHLPIKVFFKQSHQVMQASDAVIMASGTTTLEAMLLKKPMVIAYKVAALSYFIFSRMVKVPFIGLPNLLAEKQLAKEFIQHDATADNIATHVMALIRADTNSVQAQNLQQEYRRLHNLLKQNASERAAEAVINLIGAKAIGGEKLGSESLGSQKC
ncbi:MAG: lipid-A-disaccharide synthase [Marinagarivorans sp.]|nr:lipid-A-disaccharide synthase [Marinagarivorans sp.]